MRKAIIMLIIVVFLLLPYTALAAGITIQYDGITTEYTDAPMTVAVNNKSISMPLMPIVFNGRALVPVREVFEAMSASVAYNDEKKQIDISSGDTEISITINSPTAYVNGKSTVIPDNLTPKLINKVGESAKTMVPIRFLSETLGMKVDYDDATRNISISTPEAPQITGVMHSALSENQYYIKLTGNCRFENVEHQIMKDPVRLVIDINGVSNSLSSYPVGSNDSISQIRFGYENNRSRMVVDLKSIYSYKIIATTDNSLLISILTAKTAAEINIATQNILQTYSGTPNIITTGSNIDTPSTSTDTPPVAQNKNIVVIDAGHGKDDSGAVGKINAGTANEQTIYEKNLTLSVAQKVKKNLENAGISVVMTRDGDTYPTLYERADFANSLNAAMFVSIHINSNENPDPNGTETYYCTTNNDADYVLTSQQLATDVQKNLVDALGSKDRGVKTANFVVIKQTVMPSILIELGFISNEEELKKMCSDDYQNKAAKAISDAIEKNLSNVVVPKTAS